VLISSETLFWKIRWDESLKLKLWLNSLELRRWGCCKKKSEYKLIWRLKIANNENSFNSKNRNYNYGNLGLGLEHAKKCSRIMTNPIYFDWNSVFVHSCLCCQSLYHYFFRKLSWRTVFKTSLSTLVLLCGKTVLFVYSLKLSTVCEADNNVGGHINCQRLLYFAIFQLYTVKLL